ncbi:glycopeptide antibiotics resistance protein [Alkalibacillus filiformis]|uniref:Glycopeptide antibiotics resistance protein n=1 Tax=Alkalibacillus filiformis TaxID=200990 RepID=A0ABU0DSI4_9BACI|nr:VanZ family protein [Alkalibacillus filiformis]MDQ0351413.1 glycopeptide antibiotics resistance protein [Alkalibacillus filiformis]
MKLYFEGPVIIVALIIYIVLLLYLKFKLNKGLMYLFFFSVFYLYITQVVRYTQFPITYIPEMYDPLSVLRHNINLVPFQNLEINLKFMFLNVLLTIPFGFLLPLIAQITMRKVLLWAFLLPLIIEATQLIVGISTGYRHRIFDINDFIMNGLGVLIGFIILKASIKVMFKIFDQSHINQNKLLNYIAKR